jgi:hypothetical protein
MISDRISSVPSTCPSNGEPRDDLASCGVDDLSDRPWGDAERIGSSEVVAERGGVGDNPPLASRGSVSSDAEESRRWSGYLVFVVTRGTPGEKDGGGLTGEASPGDVMDIELFLSQDKER